MLPFPWNALFQRMQPLVMLDERVLAINQGPQAAVLRTAAGVEHRLGVLAPVPTIWRNAVRLLLPDAERELTTIISHEASKALTEPLAYFLHHLVPSFGDRDVSEAACQRCSLPEKTE
ncbi:MAG: hypothetical protein HYV60_12790, partial [Planctomycetia bacterium]|nr:hypothetical protein [Planctomycetia bacterium]